MQPGATPSLSRGQAQGKCPERDIGSLMTADSVSLGNRDYTSPVKRNKNSITGQKVKSVASNVILINSDIG